MKRRLENHFCINEFKSKTFFQLEEEKDKGRQKQTEHTDIQNKLTDDCKGLNLQIDELTSKINSLESVINSKNKLNEQLVGQL